MFAKRCAEYNSLQTTTCEDFSPKKENRNTQNTPDHLFCTLIWHCPIWMKNGHIWLKLVDIAYLAGNEKVQMIYTFHIFFKDQRKSKHMMQIFKLEIACILQTLKSISENLMASWKNYFDNYIFL